MRRMIVTVVCLLIMAQPVAAQDMVDRMAAGIEAWKRAGASGAWWSCGAPQADGGGIARELAGYIVAEAAARGVNPWGVAGVIAKESRFDECAIGKRSRDWAYRNGVLRPDRRTISHRKEDVLAVLASRAWRREVGRADLGLPQLMWPTVYRGDPAALLDRAAGVLATAREMQARATSIGAFVRAAVLRPWSTWPGQYDAAYDRSVVRYARALGATRADLAAAPAGAGRVRHTTMVPVGIEVRQNGVGKEVR